MIVKLEFHLQHLLKVRKNFAKIKIGVCLNHSENIIGENRL